MRSRPKLRGVSRHPLRIHRAPLAPGERRARRVPAKEPAIGGGPRSTPHASGAENATAECSAAKPAIVTSATRLCPCWASVTGIPPGRPPLATTSRTQFLHDPGWTPRTSQDAGSATVIKLSRSAIITSRRTAMIWPRPRPRCCCACFAFDSRSNQHGVDAALSARTYAGMCAYVHACMRAMHASVH